MKRLKLIVSPLAKGQTREMKVFYKTMYGLPVAQKVYASIKENMKTLTSYPGLGYVGGLPSMFSDFC